MSQNFKLEFIGKKTTRYSIISVLQKEFPAHIIELEDFDNKEYAWHWFKQGFEQALGFLEVGGEINSKEMFEMWWKKRNDST